jgi:hypothetical protein
MALSQADHFEAARQQLLNKRRDAEAEIREINEAVAGLDAAARKLTGKPGAPFKSEPEEKAATRTLANRALPSESASGLITGPSMTRKSQLTRSGTI